MHISFGQKQIGRDCEVLHLTSTCLFSAVVEAIDERGICSDTQAVLLFSRQTRENMRGFTNREGREEPLPLRPSLPPCTGQRSVEQP